MPERLLHLAAYDIRHHRRLRQCLYVLKDFACGGQKSVFECYLHPYERDELIARMLDVMDDSEDRFLVVPLQTGPVQVMGVAVQPMDPDFFYVG